MMHHTSQGVRNAARKVSNGLIHGSGHNGPGSTNQTRSIHLETQVRSALHTPRSPPFTFGSVRTRNLSNKLFSASKNFLQRFFTHLTTPGFRAPFHPSQLSQIGTRSLHTGIRNTTIRNGLSFVSRQALRNNVLQRQANTFFPRGPPQVQPCFGGVAQVGLGSARNFTTVRPIFENLVHNVPVAARALYEVDLEANVLKNQQQIRRSPQKVGAETKAKEMQKQKQSTMKYLVKAEEVESMLGSQKSAFPSIRDMDHFFPEIHDPSVTTYLLIPLAPTPTSRLPLDPNPGVVTDATFLPPLADLGILHASHLNHSLKVSTIFTRLDQAKVWETGGVSCSAYSQGRFHQRQVWEKDGSDVVDEGVCTILKIKFSGWTKAQVRGVIGESGSGWCVLEEVYHEENASESDGTLETCSSISSALASPRMSGMPLSTENENHDFSIDPSESLILPTLDVLIGLPPASPTSVGAGPEPIPEGMEVDPWNDASYPYSPLSSFSELSDFIVDPPSLNGWFETEMQFSYRASHRSTNESEGIPGHREYVFH